MVAAVFMSAANYNEAKGLTRRQRSHLPMMSIDYILARYGVRRTLLLDILF